MISIVIPTYNEADSLSLLFDQTLQVMESLSQPWELIFVDDGSTDGSMDILRRLVSRHPQVTVIELRRNYGKSLALNSAFQIAQGEVLITMDADLQDDPVEIPRLLSKLAEGYDVVSGWKQNRLDPLSKVVPSRLANFMTSTITGVKLKDMNSGFKAYRADCVRKLSLYGDLHRFIPALADDAGFHVTEIPVTHRKRRFGYSKYGPGRLLSAGFDLLTVAFLRRYSRRPLHLFGGTGITLLFIGLVINIWLSIQWVLGKTTLSERPLLILGVLLMVVGVQLLTMGLIAELLVSYIQRNEDPLNTVRRIHRNPNNHLEE